MRKSSGRAAAHLAGLPMFLRAPRAAGLWLVGVLIPVATMAGFVLSYRGLFDWALTHGWPLYLAPLFPLLIDLLIIAGEVVLFVAAIDGNTPRRVRAAAWVMVLAFTTLSVVGNVDHAPTDDPLTRGGWGLPPLVMAVALGFGLGELKRQAAKYRETVPVAVPVAPPGRVRLPSTREIRARQNCGPETAKKILAELRAFERGRGDSIHIGAGSAPATSRSRDGARAAGQPPAVPAASLPAGAGAPRSAAPAGAEVQLNGSGRG